MNQNALETCSILKSYPKMPVNDYRVLVNRAHVVLSAGRQSGAMNPSPCAICGKTRVQGHHDNYFEPSRVIWLCPKHHSFQHKRHQKIQWLGQYSLVMEDTPSRMKTHTPRIIPLFIYRILPALNLRCEICNRLFHWKPKSTLQATSPGRWTCSASCAHVLIHRIRSAS